MHYLIKYILFLVITHNALANENTKNQILFKINNKAFTNIDLENRKDYIAKINNLAPSKFNKIEKKEILDDYISSLIFYEFYLKNKIVYKNLNDEVDSIYKKKFKESKKLIQIKIKNLKFNTKIDLIRKKIIEEKLNLKRNSLLQEVNTDDLLYNFNLQYIIIKEDFLDTDLVENTNNLKKFTELKEFLIKNKIDFFYKEEIIKNNTNISIKIKNIIDQNIPVYKNNEKGYINLISIDKNLVSYEGIYVKLVNFKSSTPFEKEDLLCEKLNKIIDINKTVFKEYEYSKLNNNIKSNLKSINDYILFSANDEYNYIILCDLSYDENFIKNINFNKNVNFLIDKIQKQFLNKYKNEYKVIEIK